MNVNIGMIIKMKFLISFTFLFLGATSTKGKSQIESKNSFKNFILVYLSKYNRHENLKFKDINKTGVISLTEEGMGTNPKTVKINEGNFFKKYKQDLYGDFKFINEESDYKSWELKKSGNKYTISIMANLTFYDFTFTIENNHIYLEKINRFYDT